MWRFQRHLICTIFVELGAASKNDFCSSDLCFFKEPVARVVGFRLLCIDLEMKGARVSLIAMRVLNVGIVV